MQFFLTTYIYPIEQAISLSKRLSFSLDNPRTEEEIDLIELNLKTSLDSPSEMYELARHMRIPISHSDDDIFTVKKAIMAFYKNYPNDKYLEAFSQKYNRESVFRQLARMWIIARYDDEGEIQSMRDYISQREENEHGFFLLDDDHPIVKNSNNLVAYSYLISLLINDSESYYGDSFIFHDSHIRIQEPEIDKYINNVVLFFSIYSSHPTCDDDLSWKIAFPCAKEKIINQSKIIEESLVDDSIEKILYIANLLKTSNMNIQDEKYKLITYVGILELLLTHNPNFMRFNIEDSINKQFQLKVATLVYLGTNRRNSIKSIQKRLKAIYQQRSNIAHGNFGEVNKYIKNLSKKEGQEEYFSDLVSDTIKYIAITITEYLKDREFIDFLKDN